MQNAWEFDFFNRVLVDLMSTFNTHKLEDLYVSVIDPYLHFGALGDYENFKITPAFGLFWPLKETIFIRRMWCDVM